MKKISIAVIGAGVIGMSIARSLAIKGAQVTLFEREFIGAGTSSTTFGWVNSNGKSPDSYHQLNVESMHEHQLLQANSDTEGQWLDQCGTYEWAAEGEPGQWLADRAQKLQQSGYPARLVSAASLRRRIPELQLGRHHGEIWHFPSEGIIYPSIFLARLWSEAREHGAVLRAPVGVVDITETADAVALTLADGEIWRGDLAVSATGRWTQALVARLGQTLAMTDANQPDKLACGFLGYTQPLPVQLRSNLITPDMNLRPDGGGRLLLQALDLDGRADPAYLPSPEGFIGRELLQRLRRILANTQHARIGHIAVGQRSRPADGLPAVGFITPLQKTYIVATHSGITLAPLLGRLVAEELIDEARSPLLADYAPDRLLGKNAEDFKAAPGNPFPAAQ